MKIIFALLLSSTLFSGLALAQTPAQAAQPVAPAVVGRTFTEPAPAAVAHKSSAKKQHAKAGKKAAAKKSRKGASKKVNAHTSHKVSARNSTKVQAKHHAKVH